MRMKHRHTRFRTQSLLFALFGTGDSPAQDPMHKAACPPRRVRSVTGWRNRERGLCAKEDVDGE